MTFNADTHVSEIAAAAPASVRVFQAYGIDFCCGGKRPLGVVCDEKRLAVDEVSRAITEAIQSPASDERDWTREPLAVLADHIVTTYHNALRRELPRLRQLASRARTVHGHRSPHDLTRIEAILGELAADLDAHMKKEELVLFPIIRQLDRRAHPESGVPIAAPIRAMEQEHDSAGELLFELRRITDRYVAPDWACVTWRALYAGLAELESDMHVHVHLENNVLFPRALGRADQQHRDIADQSGHRQRPGGQGDVHEHARDDQ